MPKTKSLKELEQVIEYQDTENKLKEKIKIAIANDDVKKLTKLINRNLVIDLKDCLDLANEFLSWACMEKLISDITNTITGKEGYVLRGYIFR